MESDEDVKTTSISKGCFLFKPVTVTSLRRDASPRKRKKKSSKNDALQAVDFFRTFTKENKTERLQRYQHFANCWGKFEGKIEEVQSALNSQIFTDLLEYIQKAKIKSQTSHIEGTFNVEIPTAVLVTGVNLPDHGTVFTQFVNQLKDETTPFAIRLQSKECSNLKAMIKNAFDRIYRCAYKTDMSENSFKSKHTESEQENEDDDDDDGPLINKRSKSIFSEYTFHEFKTWFFKELENQNFSSKGVTPPVVLVFEDFERFTPAVLQDFILICSEHSKDIPMTFVLGVATTVSAVHTTLPHSVATRLSIEKFQSQPSLVCLTHLVDQVLMNNINAFKLGPSIFRLLYEHFLYHDFSVKNFIRALKFCVMEHFNNSLFNVMCVDDEDFICEYITNLDPILLKELKKISSMASYIDKKSKSEQTKLANNTTHAKDTILKLIDDLNTHEARFYPIVKCFHVLTSKLPGYPMGKRLRDTYEYCVCSQKITKEKKYETSLGLLRLLSRVELQESLIRCIEILQEAFETGRCDDFEEDLKVLRGFMSKIYDLDKPQSDVDKNQPQNEKVLHNTPKTPTVYKNRFEFQEQLKMAVKEKRKQNPYEKLRCEIVDSLDKILKKYLYSPMFLPLHEIFYYDDMENVRKRMNGTPRVAIQQALIDPYTYLHCSCCKDTASEIYDCQPDICILYKLHTECGKLINLYDWLQAYITVIDPTLTQKKKSKAKQQKEDQLQARFIRGVSELQFLGFIKSTKRKTDHVARLTWGSC